MAEQAVDIKHFVSLDLAEAIVEKALPAITVYNRLEARPRTLGFQRSLKAEVRDALWMLTRQWQLGEFRGDDAGSPFFAKLQLERSTITRYRPREGATQTFDDALPLEARVERRPIGLRQRGRPMSLDLRLVMGRYWLKLIADIADYHAEFLAAYPITAPDPEDPADADRAAHPESWQGFATVAGRRMDGGALYLHLTETPGAHPWDGVGGSTRATTWSSASGPIASSPGSGACWRRRPATTRTPGTPRAWSIASAARRLRPAARRSTTPTSTTAGTWTGGPSTSTPPTRASPATATRPTSRPSPTTRSRSSPSR